MINVSILEILTSQIFLFFVKPGNFLSETNGEILKKAPSQTRYLSMESNTKTAFNGIFKKYTKMTPSQYKKNANVNSDK